jgi:hypothetical protein
MPSLPFHPRHRGPILAAVLLAAGLLLLVAKPVRRAFRPEVPPSGVVVEFRHPAATSTARLKLVAGSGALLVRESGSGTVHRPERGRVVIEIGGAPRNFEIEVPRATPLVEIHVSDRTVFRRQGSVVTTIWPVDADSTWLVPLTP